MIDADVPEQVEALVIGAGPAGLMAGEMLADNGCNVVMADAMPTPGRKFLMAGRSGLNLTRAEPRNDFLRAFRDTGRGHWLGPILAEFGPADVTAWAEDLGQSVFTGTSGRVFPHAMKASPLLRAWRARLDAKGVSLRSRWRWTGWESQPDGSLITCFETPEGPRGISAGATVLALGGASWPRLGSDGSWARILEEAGVPLVPFEPSNVGFAVNWSAHMARFFGTPVKAVALSAGGSRHRGEFIVTRRGVEGGGIYALSQRLRDQKDPVIVIDLVPGHDLESIARRLARPRGGATLSNHLRKSLGLPRVKIALLRECAPDALGMPDAIAGALKSLPLRLEGPFSIDEAISTAGGLAEAGLTARLMLHTLPGVFCAGEMLDWDAPTGGYLISGCLATGRHAGNAAAEWIGRGPDPCGLPPSAHA